MTNTLADADYFLKHHPTRDGKTWNEWCLSFVYRSMFVTRAGKDVGGRSATTAYKAYLATKALGQIYSTDPTKAPKGAIHYWGFSAVNPGAGHVAYQVDDKGTVAMASTHITKSFGSAVGTVNVQTYTHTTGLHYLGWGTLIGQTFKGTIIDPAKQKAAIAAAKKSAAAAAKAKPAPVTVVVAKPAATAAKSGATELYLFGNSDASALVEELLEVIKRHDLAVTKLNVSSNGYRIEEK